MITNLQIKQIRDRIGDPVAISKLLDEWSNDLHVKEMSNGQKIELNIFNAKGETKLVAAQPLKGGVMAWHKSPWGRKPYYTITHIKTRLSLTSGNLKNIKSAVVYLNETVDFWPVIDIDDPQLLKFLTSEQMDILRNASKLARGEQLK